MKIYLAGARNTQAISVSIILNDETEQAVFGYIMSHLPGFEAMILSCDCRDTHNRSEEAKQEVDKQVTRMLQQLYGALGPFFKVATVGADVKRSPTPSADPSPLH